MLQSNITPFPAVALAAFLGAARIILDQDQFFVGQDEQVGQCQGALTCMPSQLDDGFCDLGLPQGVGDFFTLRQALVGVVHELVVFCAYMMELCPLCTLLARSCCYGWGSYQVDEVSIVPPAGRIVFNRGCSGCSCFGQPADGDPRE